MKQTNCPHEEAAAKAARSGVWQDSLRMHASGCAVCREVVEAASWMQGLARGSESDFDPREANLAWWRAQLAEQQAQGERAQAAAAWIEIVSIALAVGGISCWAAANWLSLQEGAAWLWTSFGPQAWMASYSAAEAHLTPFWSIVIALSLVAIFVAYPILAEE